MANLHSAFQYIILLAMMLYLWSVVASYFLHTSQPQIPGDPGFVLSHAFQKTSKDKPLRMFSIDHGRVSALQLSTMSLPSVDFKQASIMRLPHNSKEAIEQRWAHARRAKKMGVYSSFMTSFETQWIKHPAIIPNVQDQQSVVVLANMAANAYVPDPHQGDWTNITDDKISYGVSRVKQDKLTVRPDDTAGDQVGDDGEGWKHDDGFGWETDGLRGYVFHDKVNDIAVLAIKGTSAAVFDDGGPTGPKDKINDNLFFSCCCARISYMWNTVCDCYLGSNHGTQMCDENCIEEALWDQDHYYRGLLELYDNVRKMFPSAHIWVVGHSLGGAMSSMLGRTFGLPAVSFEAPGDRLAIRRLHLPTPPGVPIWDDHVWQIGHNADPIYTGDCNGAGSSCWISGYAMESRCHTGLQCMYDVVGELGWSSSIANHRIHVVIEDVLKKYNGTATCVVPPICLECQDWDMIDTLDPPPLTSSVAQSTKPTSTSTSTSSSSEQETVCLTREWYGYCRSWGVPTTTESSVVASSTAVVQAKSSIPVSTLVYQQ